MLFNKTRHLKSASMPSIPGMTGKVVQDLLAIRRENMCKKNNKNAESWVFSTTKMSNESKTSWATVESTE